MITYYIIGYRKKTVYDNLKLVFPEKSKVEYVKIAKAFYRHLCDVFLEMVKMMSISERAMLKRFHIINPELIKELEAKNKSIIFLYAHYATFEYSASFTLYDITYKGHGVYKRIRNKALERIVKKIRSRFGVEMIEKNDLPKQMMFNRVDKQNAIYGMIADQSPKKKNIKHWINFLGIETPVFVGAEVLAKRMDMSVCYMKIDKVKRGYYKVELIPISTTPQAVKDYQITETYFHYLEKQILEKPEYYFWSHKRWKYSKENFVE